MTNQDLADRLVRRAASAEEAADLLADTYLVAWEKLDRLPPGDQTRLWLFGVARNLARQGRTPRPGGGCPGRALGRRTAPGDGHGSESRDERLWAALHELSPDGREIVLLTAWEGLTSREIAVVLGTSANAVRISLHRARRRLIGECEPVDRPRSTCSPAQLGQPAGDLRARP